MRTKPATHTTTATLTRRLAASIEADCGFDTGPERDAAAESLVRHLTTNMAQDDLETVVRFLSDALNVARTGAQDTRRTCACVDEPCPSEHWLG